MNPHTALRWLSVFSFLVAWWLASLVSAPDILPGPMAVARTIVNNFTAADSEEKSAEFHAVHHPDLPLIAVARQSTGSAPLSRIRSASHYTLRNTSA